MGYGRQNAVEHRLANGEQAAFADAVVRAPLAGSKVMAGVQAQRHQQEIRPRQDQQEPAQTLGVLDLNQTQRETITCALGVPEVLLDAHPMGEDLPQSGGPDLFLIGQQVPWLLLVGPPDDGHMAADRVFLAIVDVSQQLALTALNRPVFEEALKSPGPNEHLRLNPQDVAQFQCLTLLSHFSSTEAS